MADEQNTELDFDKMSDEDFLKQPEPEVIVEDPNAEIVPNEEEPNAEIIPEELAALEAGNTVPEPLADGSVPDGSGDGDPAANAGKEDVLPEGDNLPDPNATPQGNADPLAGEGKAPEVTPEGAEDKSKSKEETPKAVTPPVVEVEKTPATPDENTAAMDFFKKVTATIKADGKDFSVRTPEEAIRLIQQGVNYSRRMNEIKPMKAMNRLLTDHGLNDEAKISFLIDVSKGDKTAITKLLKDRGIDPMDLDVSTETSYQAKSYSGTPQEVAFRDAIDTTMETAEGKTLIGEIHDKWDAGSKQKLQERPEILGNLLELKQTGVYGKIVDELDRQKALGYLTHVPFLQAFDQVGEAMKNVGLIGSKQPAEAVIPMGQLPSNTQTPGEPVATGARKAPAPKIAQPNPHLSSTPPSTPTKQAVIPAEQNFDKMSDEDFMKMPPPE